MRSPNSGHPLCNGNPESDPNVLPMGTTAQAAQKPEPQNVTPVGNLLDLKEALFLYPLCKSGASRAASTLLDGNRPQQGLSGVARFSPTGRLKLNTDW